ncbi:MAG: AAA family ATPase [Bacteroidales bacterium]|nr:AAA family ATPase [Bacteroidales bacterium]
MIYLDSFTLASENDENNFISFNYRTHMTCYRSYYPFNIFPLKGFERMDFDAPITILYGGNGSGKTTVLNIIAQKIGVSRGALFNDAPFMEPYLNLCKFKTTNGIPESSRIIVSDDVFDYMLNVRAVNQEVELHRNQLFEVYKMCIYHDEFNGNFELEGDIVSQILAQIRKELLRVKFSNDKGYAYIELGADDISIRFFASIDDLKNCFLDHFSGWYEYDKMEDYEVQGWYDIAEDCNWDYFPLTDI